MSEAHAIAIAQTKTETPSATAIQKAIDDCAVKGGGRVLVPGGGTYVTYTLNLKNNVDLHIERGALRRSASNVHGVAVRFTVVFPDGWKQLAVSARANSPAPICRSFNLSM